jgi:hypothetical protein
MVKAEEWVGGEVDQEVKRILPKVEDSFWKSRSIDAEREMEGVVGERNQDEVPDRFHRSFYYSPPTTRRRVRWVRKDAKVSDWVEVE